MCALRKNRSGLLSALIVCLCRESGGAEAVRFVRSKVPEALTNLEFADWLASRPAVRKRLTLLEFILSHETRVC